MQQSLFPEEASQSSLSKFSDVSFSCKIVQLSSLLISMQADQ